MTDDPNSWIQASAKTLAETLSSKNSDYAPGGEFSTFEEAADFATSLTAFEVMLSQIGIKVTRIKTLAGGVMPQNESMADSLLDLAGYAVIAHAYLTANNHTIEPEPDDPLSWNDKPRVSAVTWNPAG